MPHNDAERRAFNEVFADPEAAQAILNQIGDLGVEGFLAVLGMGDNAGLAEWLGTIPSPLVAAGIAAIRDAAGAGLGVELVHRPASHFALELWESSVPTPSGRTGVVTLLLSGPSEA